LAIARENNQVLSDQETQIVDNHLQEADGVVLTGTREGG